MNNCAARLQDAAAHSTALTSADHRTLRALDTKLQQAVDTPSANPFSPWPPANEERVTPPDGLPPTAHSHIPSVVMQSRLLSQPPGPDLIAHFPADRPMQTVYSAAEWRTRLPPVQSAPLPAAGACATQQPPLHWPPEAQHAQRESFGPRHVDAVPADQLMMDSPSVPASDAALVGPLGGHAHLVAATLGPGSLLQGPVPPPPPPPPMSQTTTGRQWRQGPSHASPRSAVAPPPPGAADTGSDSLQQHRQPHGGICRQDELPRPLSPLVWEPVLPSVRSVEALGLCGLDENDLIDDDDLSVGLYPEFRMPETPGRRHGATQGENESGTQGGDRASATHGPVAGDDRRGA